MWSHSQTVCETKIFFSNLRDMVTYDLKNHGIWMKKINKGLSLYNMVKIEIYMI